MEVEDRGRRVESWVDFAQSKKDSILGRRYCLSKDLYEKVFGVNAGRHLKTERVRIWEAKKAKGGFPTSPQTSPVYIQGFADEAPSFIIPARR